MVDMTSVSLWDTTASNNVLLSSINIDSNGNVGDGDNAIRAMMAQVAAYTRRGSDLATATTLNLDSIDTLFLNLTGTTTVTAVTLTSTHARWCRATGAFQMTASASLIVNGSTSVNYTTAANDLLFFEGYGSSVVRVWAFNSRTLYATVVPATNDGAALGTATLSFADLFLATGGVINWNNSDITVTGNADSLVFAGAATAYVFGGGPVIPTSHEDLGMTSFGWGSLYLHTNGILRWGGGSDDVTVTHSSNALAFAGATTNGYSFADGPIKPAANDGAALGVSGTAWSDLFLASGAVVNFAAGDWVATHSTGILTVGTGDLRVTSAGANTASVVTVGGTQTLTGKTLTSPTIGTSPTAAGATWTNLGTVTTADINGGTIDGTIIGGSSVAAGSFAAVVATTIDASGKATITTATTGATNPQAEFVSTDTGASGNYISLYRDSSGSAAVNDFTGAIAFFGRDSANNKQLYGDFGTQIVDPTSTTEAALMYWATTIAGSNAIRMRLGAGLTVGATPTGGDKGLGTINVSVDIYKNNGAYTNPDYVFEHAYTGKVERFAENDGAAAYTGLPAVDEMERFTREHLRLPGITDDPTGMFERSDLALRHIESLYLYIFEMNNRIKALEAKLAA